MCHYKPLLAFAKIHDWGVDAYANETGVYVFDEYTGTWLIYTSFKKLRDWAGY